MPCGQNSQGRTLWQLQWQQLCGQRGSRQTGSGVGQVGSNVGWVGCSLCGHSVSTSSTCSSTCHPAAPSAAPAACHSVARAAPAAVPATQQHQQQPATQPHQPSQVNKGQHRLPGPPSPSRAGAYWQQELASTLRASRPLSNRAKQGRGIQQQLLSSPRLANASSGGGLAHGPALLLHHR